MIVSCDWKFSVAILCLLGAVLPGCSRTVPVDNRHNNDNVLTQAKDHTEDVLSPSELRERRLALKKTRESQLAALYAAHGHQTNTAPQEIPTSPYREKRVTPKAIAAPSKKGEPTPEKALSVDAGYTIQLGVFRSHNNLKSALERFPLKAPLYTFNYTADLTAYAAGNFSSKEDAQNYTKMLIENGIHEFHIRRLPKHSSVYKKTQP